jgi:hypothetical protein
MTVQVELKKPQHLISLATSSLLVSVDVKVWTATKQDRGISEEITTAKKADRDSGRFIKHLLSNDPDHKRVINYRQTVYNWLQRRTYDWSASFQCLPFIDLPKFKKEFDNHKLAFQELVDSFIDKYPTIVSNMAFAQGDMFDRNDYPTPEQIRGKFGIELFTAEIPMGDHRCKIAEDLADDLFNNYSRQTEQIISQMMDKQSEQLINVMSSISHCCGVDESIVAGSGETKIKKRKIYDTTISRALELCDTFKSFNLTNSMELEQARSALERTLRGVNVDILRESDAVRESVKVEVDDILSKFRPVLGQELV